MVLASLRIRKARHLANIQSDPDSMQNLFLVGLMGAGKTTVGRLLARKLGKRFIDSDHEIEARTGASIPWIFEIEGEASFRRREAEFIRDLSALSDIVLATGGGAILNPETRALMKQRGKVIYLRASVNSIMLRTSNDKNRPLLQTANPRAKIEELARQREPLYAEVADLVIDTGRPNVQYLVQSIIHQLGWPQHEIPSPVKSTMNTCLNVDLGERSYPIIIGPELLLDAALLARHIVGKRIVIVTNTTVAPLYLGPLKQALLADGREVLEIILPDGEVYKDWVHLMRVFDDLLTHRCDRKTTLVALGGGVIGDLTGFAAASYMRGIPFVQIPTTLLSQVDSSVGGKTGINHPLGKNMIGAFYQPQAVLADTSSLNTLSTRELSAGLSEIIKYGAIIDLKFFEWLEQNIDKLLARDQDALTWAIAKSCEIKADIVRQDEREGGLRAILNFGHTFGHAIEAGMGYGEWLHGEAVGCGMVLAADLSYRMGFIDYVSKTRVKALVEAAGLPTRAPNLGPARWLELMEVDKKNEGGAIKFILLKPLGACCVMSAPQQDLLATLAAGVE